MRSSVQGHPIAASPKEARFEAYRRIREEVAVHIRPIVERLLNESLDREVDDLLGRACYVTVPENM